MPNTSWDAPIDQYCAVLHKSPRVARNLRRCALQLGVELPLLQESTLRDWCAQARADGRPIRHFEIRYLRDFLLWAIGERRTWRNFAQRGITTEHVLTLCQPFPLPPVPLLSPDQQRQRNRRLLAAANDPRLQLLLLLLLVHAVSYQQVMDLNCSDATIQRDQIVIHLPHRTIRLSATSSSGKPIATFLGELPATADPLFTTRRPSGNGYRLTRNTIERLFRILIIEANRVIDSENQLRDVGNQLSHINKITEGLLRREHAARRRDQTHDLLG